MAKKRLKLTDQLRRAMDASGVSRYRISQETGIAEATLSRFMSGKGGLSMEGLDAIADYLRLNIVAEADKK
jgi:transcriptional regulator with XRE-family HTH domain